MHERQFLSEKVAEFWELKVGGVIDKPRVIELDIFKRSIVVTKAKEEKYRFGSYMKLGQHVNVPRSTQRSIL